MTMQHDAKLLIEDANIDRYIDIGSSQIEELSIGNFKVEITSAIVIGAGVLLGAVPKIAHYAADIYKNHLTAQISDLTNKTIEDASNLHNVLDSLRTSSSSIIGSSVEPTPVLDALKNIISDTSKLHQSIPEGIKHLNNLSDRINTQLDLTKTLVSNNPEQYTDSWLSNVSMFVKTATDKTIESINTLGRDLTKIDSLSEKINGLADKNDPGLSSVSKNIDSTSVDVVWGVMFIALTVIALSIIMKVVNSMSGKNKGKKITIKKAMSFMKSTKRIISKSLTKKSKR